MPFNNKRNSRDGKSNQGGKSTFSKRTEENAKRSSRSDDKKPHAKRSDKASGSSFDAKRSDDNRPRPYNKSTSSSFSKKDDRPFNRDDRSFKREDRPFKKDDNSFKKEDGSKREYKSYKKPEYKKDDRFKKADHFQKPESSNKNERPRRDAFNKDERPKRNSFSKDERPRSGSFNKDEKPRRDSFGKTERPRKDSFTKDEAFKKEDKPFRKTASDRPRTPRKDTDNEQPKRSYVSGEPELIRLNRYIANAGICSRRKADELIEAGVVSVNGEVVTSLGTRVNPAVDEVKYNGERLKREKMVYVLLNKPKDYITTTDDPQERRTVMHLVEKATRERIYPIGRLDRNTTGLLLMTNDGELAEKLSHPRNSITKIYQVELNKTLTQGDFNKIEYGLELEDGLIKPDSVSYVQGASKKEIGIQIHSGKNRIVRRIFEHLGYDVVKLDRVIYANLTKKDLPRGRWRYLDEKEIIQLKHFIK